MGELSRLLLGRRSTKVFRDEPLSLDLVRSALWSVAGQTRDGRRVVPSARST
ncbi:MAG: hypothetical protein GX555_11945 [Actinomycetales bacterium]|nr:hypothetical protein [Actinomycetales bacterium]